MPFRLAAFLPPAGTCCDVAGEVEVSVVNGSFGSVSESVLENMPV